MCVGENPNVAAIGIVGAGIGGLSAASSLVGAGHDVTIFEKESSPGGRARRVSQDTAFGNYLTEVGPTVFTMLDVAQLPFETLDSKMDDFVSMIRVDPNYRGQFADGTHLDWPADPNIRFEVLTEFAGEKDADGFEQYVTWLEKLFVVEYENFIARNFGSPLDLLKTPGALVQLVKMGAFSKMDRKVQSFISDPRLISMSTFQSLYAGVTPSQALAIYCIISYMDLVQGVYYPKGGMCSYGEGLADALTHAGAKIHYDTPVQEIRTARGGNHEIMTSSSSEVFDAVICNADLAYAYPEILGEPMPKKVERGLYSPSCLVFVVGGVTKSLKRKAHHEIHFSSNDEKGFKELVESRSMMSDPSFLISSPCVSDPEITPEGSDVFYVLEPCPNLSSQVGFEGQREFHVDRMKGHLSQAGVVFDRIDCELVYDPNDWDGQRMYQGTPFSMAHTFFQSGPFRPKNKVKKRPGLVLCGTGTTPGVGIPMVIESGRLAAKAINDYLASVRS